MPIHTIAELSRAWYGDRLDPAFEPPPPEQRQVMLTEVGLTGPFWQLSQSDPPAPR